jgi:hypothetical protein
MNNNWVRRITLLAPLFAVVVLIATVTDVNAQTTTRRRTRSIPIPAPTATPSADAEIISRADELNDENSRAIPPDPNDPSGVIGADRTGISTLEELGNRIRNLEAAGRASKKVDPDEKQKRLLLNLDILSRAEQRSDALRKQVFDMMEKENTIRAKLDTVEYDLRPEMIERSVALIGTLRPEEIRASKRKSLESERTNLQTLLTEIQRTRSSLEISLQRADALVEKLRTKFEKDIDTSLDDDPPRNDDDNK